jgi:hypothetical protein
VLHIHPTKDSFVGARANRVVEALTSVIVVYVITADIAVPDG